MITKEDIFNSPDNYVWVFGDNLAHTGYGGQAGVARQFVYCGKAFGIPTKRKPSSDDDAYFSDQADEMVAVSEAFSAILSLSKRGKHIIFFPGIGEGYAQLKDRSPEIYKMVKETIRAFCTSGAAEIRKG